MRIRRYGTRARIHKRLRIERDIDEGTGEVLDEHPMFLCFNNHKNFWATIPNLQEDPRNPEDVDTKQEDHIYDEFRYMCMARPIQPKLEPRKDTGSFQAERRRLIKAKEYARRHGVGIDVAYGRVR